MRARGHYVWRMVRNPLHIFTAVRDRIRYRGHRHRAIVALIDGTRCRPLRREYGTRRRADHRDPNGVDLDRFHPCSADERTRAQAASGSSHSTTTRWRSSSATSSTAKGLPAAHRRPRRSAPTVLLWWWEGVSQDGRRRASPHRRARCRRPGDLRWASGATSIPYPGGRRRVRAPQLLRVERDSSSSRRSPAGCRSSPPESASRPPSSSTA